METEMVALLNNARNSRDTMMGVVSDFLMKLATARQPVQVAAKVAAMQDGSITVTAFDIVATAKMRVVQRARTSFVAEYVFFVQDDMDDEVKHEVFRFFVSENGLLFDPRNPAEDFTRMHEQTLGAEIAWRVAHGILKSPVLAVLPPAKA